MWCKMYFDILNQMVTDRQTFLANAAPNYFVRPEHQLRLAITVKYRCPFLSTAVCTSIAY